jgi:hypothetical protein
MKEILIAIAVLLSVAFTVQSGTNSNTIVDDLNGLIR